MVKAEEAIKKDDVMEEYWKSAENDVIENHEAKNH